MNTRTAYRFPGIMAILLGICLAATHTVAQDISAVSSGFCRHESSSYILHSVVGIPVVGRSQSSDLVLESGLLNLPPFYHAIINDPPEIISSPELFVEELEPFVYRARATDPEDDPVTFSFFHVPSYMTARDSSISWTPQVADPPDSFMVVASDGTLRDTLWVRVITVTSNQKPYFTSALIDTVNEEEPFSYTATAEDPENAPLAFTFINLPDWIDPETGIDGATLSGIPPEGSAMATFTIIVDDGRWKDTAWVTLIIRSINNPPVITSPSSVTATEHELFTYVATVRDPDCPDPVVWFDHLPANWEWRNARYGQVQGDTLRGVPGEFAATSFWVFATDGEFTDSMEVTIDLTRIDDPPAIISAPHIKVFLASEAIYVGVAVDPERQPVTISFENYPPLWSMPVGDTLRMVVPAFAEFIDSFTVIAADPAGLSDTLTVVINAVTTNEPPAITSPARVSARDGEPFSYVVTAEDPDDSLFTFQYLYLPSWLENTTAQGARASRDSLYGIPDGALVIDRFTVVVSDGGREPDTLEVIIDITVENAAPAILSMPITSAVVGEQYTYRVRAVDREGHSFEFSLGSAPEGMSINAGTGVITWTPDQNSGNEAAVEVIVADEYGAQSSQEFSIRILRDSRPSATMETIANGRGDITVRFELYDAAGDTLSLKVYYLDEDGGWRQLDKKAIDGNLTAIDPSRYADSLVWHSAVSHPGISLATRLMLVPSNPSATGAGVQSNMFTVDNTPYPVFGPVFPAPDTTLQTWECREIIVTVSGPSIDPVTINKNTITAVNRHGESLEFDTVIVSSTRLVLVPAVSFSASDTVTVTLHATLRDTTGKSIGEPFGWSFYIAPCGDFNKDGVVSYLDLPDLAAHWIANAEGAPDGANIGPAVGVAPHLTSATTDSVFDHEDLFTFLDMWRYFAALDTAYIRELSKRAADQGDRPRFQTVQAAVSRAQWNTILDIEIDGRDLHDLSVCHYRLVFDKNNYEFVSHAGSPFLKTGNARVLELGAHADGWANLDMVRLCEKAPSVYGSGRLASFSLKKRGLSNAPVSIEYALLNSAGEIIESGVTMVTPEEPADRPARIDSIIVVPNPSGPAPVAAPFEVRNAPEVLNLVSSGVNGCALVFTVSAPNLPDEKLMVRIRIFDRIGAVVAATPVSEILGRTDSGAPTGSGRFTVYWDGRASNGSPVSPGVYLAVLSWSNGQSSGTCTTRIGIK